jgi:hypothetical protein
MNIKSTHRQQKKQTKKQPNLGNLAIVARTNLIRFGFRPMALRLQLSLDLPLSIMLFVKQILPQN